VRPVHEHIEDQHVQEVQTERYLTTSLQVSDYFFVLVFLTKKAMTAIAAVLSA
jgi:hypothetical protein